MLNMANKSSKTSVCQKRKITCATVSVSSASLSPFTRSSKLKIMKKTPSLVILQEGFYHGNKADRKERLGVALCQWKCSQEGRFLPLVAIAAR